MRQRFVCPIVAMYRLVERIVCFDGRSSRSEYWWPALVLGMVAAVVETRFPYVPSAFAALLMIALSIRRLHDTGRSGWWLLLSLIPVIGSLILVVFYLFPSSPDNKYGEVPNCA